MSLYVPAQFVVERGPTDRDRLFAFWKELPDAARDTLLSFTPAQVLDELVQTMTQQRVLLRAAAAERDYADGAMVGPMRQYPWEATPQHHYVESRVGATFFDDTPAKLGADIGLRNGYAGSGDRVLAEALLRAPGSQRRLTAELLLRRGLGVDSRAAPPTLRPAPYTFESWDAEEVEYADAARVRALCDYMGLPEPSDVQLQATQIVPPPAADPRNAGPEAWAWSARHVEEGRLGACDPAPSAAGGLGAIAFAAGSRLDRMRLIKPSAGIRTPETKPPSAAHGLPGSALCPGPCAPNDVVRFTVPPHAIPELPYDITADPLRPAVPRWASTLQRGDRDLPLCADPEHVESREFADALARYAQCCMQLWDMPRILADVMKVVRVALNTGQSVVRLDALLRRILPSVTGPSTAILEGVTYAVAPPTEKVVPGRCWPPPPRLDEPLTATQQRDACANLLGAMRELAKGASTTESALTPRTSGPSTADETLTSFVSQVASCPLLERHRGSGCKVSQVWNPRSGHADANVWRLEAWHVLPHAADTTGNGADPNDSATSFMSDWSLDDTSVSSNSSDVSETPVVHKRDPSSDAETSSDSDDVFHVTDKAEREFLAQVRAGDDIVPPVSGTRRGHSGTRRFDAASDPVFAQAAALLAESSKAQRRLRRDKNRLRASLMEPPGDGKALEEICRLPYMDDMMVWVLVHSVFCAMRVAVRRVRACRGACSRVDERTLFTTSVPDHLRLVNGGAPRTTTHAVDGNVFAAALRATNHGRTALKEHQQGLLGIEDHWAIPSFEGGLGTPSCDLLGSAVARIRPLVADGERAMRLGISDRAAAAFTQAIDYATPSAPRLVAQALCGRATAYQAAGAHLLAVQDCTAALLLDPAALEAQFVRATTYALLAESAWAARHRMGKSFFACAMLNLASLAASGDRRMAIQAAAAANRLLYRIYRQSLCMVQEAEASTDTATTVSDETADAQDAFFDSAVAEAEARVRRLEEWSTADPHFIPDHDDGADEVDAAIQRRAASSAGATTSCCRLEVWLNEPLLLPTDVASAFPVALAAHLRRRVEQREGLCKRVEARFGCPAGPPAAPTPSASGLDPVFPWEAGWAPLFATDEPVSKEAAGAGLRSSWVASDDYDDHTGRGTHRRVVDPDGPTNRARRMVSDWANARPGARQWGHWLVCGNPLVRAVPSWLSAAAATQAHEDAFRDAAFLRTAQSSAASHPEVVAACGALPAAIIDLTIALLVQPSLRRTPQYWAALARRQVELDARARDRTAHSIAQPTFSAGRQEPHAMDVAAAAYNYFARHSAARPSDTDTERAGAAARADGVADDTKAAASGAAFPPPQSTVPRTAQETMTDWFTPMPTGANGSTAYIRAQYLAAAEATAHELEGPLRDAELRVQRRLQEELMKIPDFHTHPADHSAARASPAAGGAAAAASGAPAASGAAMQPLPTATMSEILDVLTGKKNTTGTRGGATGAFSTILQTLEKQLQGASPSAVAGGPSSIAFQQEIEQRLLQLGIRLPPSMGVGAALEGIEAEEAARMAEAMQHVVPSKRPRQGGLATAATPWSRPSVSANARALLGGATVEETLQFIMGDEKDTKAGKRKADKKNAPGGKKKGAAPAAKVAAKKGGAAPPAVSASKATAKPDKAPRAASAAPSTSTAWTARALGEPALDDDVDDLSTDPDSELFEMDPDFLQPGACAFGLRDEGVGAVDEGLDDDDFDEEEEEEEMAAALTVFEALRAASQLKQQQQEQQDAAAAAAAAATFSKPPAPKSVTSRASSSTVATAASTAKTKTAVAKEPTKGGHPTPTPAVTAKGPQARQAAPAAPAAPPAEPAKTKQQLQREREQQEARERKERERLKRLRTIETNLQQLQERGVKERKPCEIEEQKGFERILGAASHSLKVAKGKEASRLAAEAAQAEADRVAAEKAALETKERTEREKKLQQEAADKAAKEKSAKIAADAAFAVAAVAAATAQGASAAQKNQQQQPQQKTLKAGTEAAAGSVAKQNAPVSAEPGKHADLSVKPTEAPTVGKGGKAVPQRTKDTLATVAPANAPTAASPTPQAPTPPPSAPPQQAPAVLTTSFPGSSPALGAAPPSYTEFLDHTGMTPPSLRPTLPPRGVAATPVSTAAAARWPPTSTGAALNDDGGFQFDLTALAAFVDPTPLDALAPSASRGPSSAGAAAANPVVAAPAVVDVRRGPSLLSALRDGSADDDDEGDVAGEMLMLLSASTGAAPPAEPVAALLGAGGGLVGAPSAAPSWPSPSAPAASAATGSAQLFGLWEEDDLPGGSGPGLGLATPLALPVARAPLLEASLAGPLHLGAAAVAPGTNALLDVASIWGAPEPLVPTAGFLGSAAPPAPAPVSRGEGPGADLAPATAVAAAATPIWRVAAPASSSSASPVSRVDGGSTAASASMRPPLRALQQVARYPDDADVRQSADIARRAAAVFHAPPDVVAGIAAAIAGSTPPSVVAAPGSAVRQGAAGGLGGTATRRTSGAATAGAATGGGSRRR